MTNIPTNVIDRDVSAELQEEIRQKKREMEGRNDTQEYIYIFQVSKCHNFKELMTLFERTGYLLKLTMTHETYLDTIPELIRHTCIMKETPEDYVKRKENEIR